VLARSMVRFLRRVQQLLVFLVLVYLPVSVFIFSFLSLQFLLILVVLPLQHVYYILWLMA
jgi:hypothetical protein